MVPDMPMQMDLSVYQKLDMRMRLAPQIIQSIEILQLPTLELEQRVNQELLENPLLEQVEPSIEQIDPLDREQVKDERTSDETEFDKLLEMEERLIDYSSQAPVRARVDDKDPKIEAMQNTAAPATSLQDHLESQLSLLDLPARGRTIAENIVYNLDDNGYLQYPLSEILESMPAGTTEIEAERVLRTVQSLDPPGVAARDLRECLLLQLAPGSNIAQEGAVAGNGHFELERMLILNHLEDLLKNRLPQIARDTGRTLAEVREAAEMVCSLNPKPGIMYTTERPHYITPDVEVRSVNGGYEVVMCDDYIPQIRVNRRYVRLLRSDTTSREEKEYVKKKLQSAQWLIDSIEQRRDTLRRIMEQVVEVQREFLDKGIRFLKPLKMGTVAESAGIHVSTVSRAIAEKYALTPRGLYDIKFFFAGSAQAEGEGNGASRESVQDLVREVIESEDKRHPLSDGDIVKALKERDVSVARRTVTKYRKLMDIPSSRQRVRY
jgi:RNA polymerase sigma-54 factor